MIDPNANPELLDNFCSGGIKEAIPDFLKTAGYSIENPNPNGNVINKLFNMIFEQLNHQKSKGFSFWQNDKAYYATSNNIDIVRRNNKIFFAKQDSNIDPIATPLPKDPLTNPDFWTVFYDFDNPTLDKFLDYTLTADLINLLNLKADKATIGNTFDKPNSSVLFVKSTPTIFIIPLGFKVRVGLSLIELTSSYELDLNNDLDTGVKTAGTDYYVYAKADSTFYISADKALLVDRLIGGFHYGLTPEDELLTSYVATSPTSKTQTDIDDIKGINKYSFWDLKLLPENGIQEGKALVQNTFWRDIYPADEDYGIRGFSSCFSLFGTPAKIAGGAVTSGRAIPKIPLSKGGNGTINYGKLTQFNATELVASCGMELASYAEFQESSFGVVEEKSASELGYTTNGVISHIPELTSKYGIEMATSVQFYWGRELMNGHGSTDLAFRLGLTDNRGYIHATSYSPVATLMGGYELYTSTYPCGSRALSLTGSVWYSYWYRGFFGVCRNLKQI